MDLSLAEPDDELFKRFEAQLDTDIPTDVVDVTTIPDVDLVNRLHELDAELDKSGELMALNPRTQEARDLHSLRAAVLVEMKRRGLR